MSIHTEKSIDFSKLDMIKTQTTDIRYNGQDDTLRITENVDLRDADFSRDGADLVLEWNHGGQIVVEGYFSELTAPILQGSNGVTLPAELVQSFIKSGASFDVAQSHTLSDASPVGAFKEVTGSTIVTRVDGSVETAQIGTPVYQGDIVETDADGAVNIAFIDETSFAVSENAKLAIDEYVFDPASESGTQNFSVLKGMFVFTSGLIGREDPDDVMIETPMGSIGIRGTIIAGDTDSGEITVVEGAIVLRDFSGNEVTLANQFETAQFKPVQGTIEPLGELSPVDVAGKFQSVSGVAPDLFSSIEDAANENSEPQETKAERGEEPIEKVDGVQEEKPVINENGETSPQDGQPHEAHEAHEGEGEHAETLMEKADTLIMEDGKEKMLLGEDGKLDQSELLEILVNNSEAREAIKQQVIENRAELEAQHELAIEGSFDGPDTLADQPQYIDPNQNSENGPLVVHITPGNTSLQAPHDNVVLVGSDGFNSLVDFDLSNKNVSMKGLGGADQFQVLLDSSGSKQLGKLNGGAGVDSLTLVTNFGDTGVLDFSNVEALKSVENIDMLTSTEQETIILTPGLIFDSVGEGGTLSIDGDSGDTVQINFDANWTKDTSTPGDGYTEYYHNDGGPTTTLLIDSDVVANSGANITGV